MAACTVVPLPLFARHLLALLYDGLRCFLLLVVFGVQLWAADTAANAPASERRCLHSLELKQRYPEATSYDIFLGIHAQENCDPHDADVAVWAYSAEFAHRFEMPQRWISDELQGAQAISFRPIPLLREDCAAATTQGCAPEYRFIYTVYLAESTPIAWLSETTESAPLFWWGVLTRLNLAQRYLDQQNYAALRCFQGQRALACQHAALNKRSIQGITLHSLFLAEGALPQAFTVAYQSTSPEQPEHRVQIPAEFAQRAYAAYQQRRAAAPLAYYTPSLWIYSAAFAKRFNLPPQGISRQLRGAEAAMFRAILPGSKHCGWRWMPERCFENISFEMSLFLPQQVPIPWWRPEPEQAPQFWRVELRVLSDRALQGKGSLASMGGEDIVNILCYDGKYDYWCASSSVNRQLVEGYAVHSRFSTDRIQIHYFSAPIDGKKPDPKKMPREMKAVHKVILPADFYRTGRTV